MEFPRRCELCLCQMEDDDDLDWHGIGNCVELCPSCEADDIPCAICDGQGWIPFKEKQ
jgi:hypothetical protein